MWFKYRDIDFEYNEKYITENEIIDYFDTLIDLSLDIVKIFEISIEDKFEASYIYIEKQETDPDSWDIRTLDFIKDLSIAKYNVMCADEDYGEMFDVLIIYND